MRKIITFTFCCDNLWKRKFMALENSGNFFLLLCDHPGSGVEMGWATELQAKKIVVWASSARGRNF